MAKTLQAQYALIASGSNTHTPSFRLQGASVAALAVTGLDVNSTQTVTLQGASAPSTGRGATFTPATSAQYVPVFKADLSGAFSILTTTGFVIGMTAQIDSMDEVRVFVSSANGPRSLTLFVKN